MPKAKSVPEPVPLTICFEKKCPKCEKHRWVKDFYKLPLAKDGLQSWCKKCHDNATAVRAKANPGRKLASVRRYQARKKKVDVTPNDPRIEALYVLAAKLREVGRDVEIDHIIPLQPQPGQTQGLHTFANLRIVPVKENRRKSNRP